MATLRNSRHERFATELANGQTQEKAYIAAGFSPSSARSSASSLIKQRPYIFERRDEILAEREMLHSVSTVQAMKELQITKQDVMKELMDNAMIAKAAIPVMKDGVPTGMYNANISASNQALMLLGKELGMFADKSEIRVDHHANMNDEELRIFVMNKYRKLGLDLEAKAVDAEIMED